MKLFDYAKADSAEAATREGAVADTKFIAGGTNLLDLMKLQIETPARLVDISRLPLGDIEEIDGGGVRIGALVPNSDLAADPIIRERYGAQPCPAGRRVGTIAEQGVDGRQPAATDALLLFL